jgi:G patch domain-containing protein 1
LDEDGGESLSLSIPKEKSKDRPKKKKRKEKEKGRKERADDEDETMWIEKPPAEAVKSIVAASTVNPDSMDVDAGEPATDRGRKKAIDFW